MHFAGHPVDLDAIQTLAQEHNLAVIEDAAHALPAAYKGRMIGSGANPVAFSFYATKNLTTAEGGMLTGDPRSSTGPACEPARHEPGRLEALRQGRIVEVRGGLPRLQVQHDRHPGGHRIVQLRRLEGFQKRRAEIVAAYNEAFGSEVALEIPVHQAHVDHAWHLYVLRLQPELLAIDRDEFIEELTARNIGTSVHFIPIHLHPYYRDKYGYLPNAFPVAYATYQRMLSLPLHRG